MPVDQLTRDLSSPDAAVRRRAVKELGRLNQAEADNRLMAALKDGDWFVRLEAVKALTEHPDPRSTEALKDLYFEAIRRNQDLSIPLGFHEFVLAALKKMGWVVSYGGFTRVKKTRP